MAEDLVLQERLNDVILKIRHDGFSWRIPAHSLLLVNRSSFFQEMLDERAEDERPTPLTMIGMRPETAVAVLKYIYENEYPADVTADLIIAAQKCKLQPLEDNLLDRLTEDMTLPQACQIFDELHLRQPGSSKCPVKDICFKMMERHAFTLFATDLVFQLSRQTLTLLLASDQLNVPDEAFVFWGIWRWGRRQSSMNDRSLKDEAVAAYIDDLLCQVRKSSVRNSADVPQIALASFNKCKPCRCRYRCPEDILDHSSLLRPCPAWVDIVPPKISEVEDQLCIQLSVEKDVLLVGLHLEMCIFDRKDTESFFVRVIQEPRKELRRQRVSCVQASSRKLSPREAPEIRIESQVVLHEPLFLIPDRVYSFYIKGNFKLCQFVWGPFSKRRMRIGNSFINFHGEGVTAVRELYVVPDVSKTWGPRGPEV